MIAPATVQWGRYALTYGVGVTLTHTGLTPPASIYFQPGDDSAAFLDRFEAMQDVAPDRPIAAILAELFREYSL